MAVLEETKLRMTRFAAGTRVPEWLLAVEPMNKDSVLDEPRFIVAVDVVEVSDRFFVIPVGVSNGPGIMSFNGSYCTITAPGKPVEAVIAKQVILGLDYMTARARDTFVKTGEPSGKKQSKIVVPVWVKDGIGYGAVGFGIACILAGILSKLLGLH